MKVIPFPKPGDQNDDTVVAQLEAALHGEGGGEAAECWRELRADVRSLAPPISPEFEQQLRERIEQCAASQLPRTLERLTARARLARARAWLGSGLHPRLLAVAGICVTAALVTLVIAAPWRGSSSPIASELINAPARVRGSLGTAGASSGVVSARQPNAQMMKRSAQAGPAVSSSTVVGESIAGRVQQLAASITLAPKPEGVQSVADQVAQLATRDGGFVQSSQVHLQHGAGGEANLQLSLPSARLSAALAQLARLAPTRAQSQSLQDITDEYGAARTKLADAVAERQALLRTLAKASTQGEIESLRARLSLAGGAISRARSAFQSVARRGSNSSMEVTVIGDAHAGSSRSTLSQGLHDAGDVLKLALALLIVALAVLVPLTLLAVPIVVAWRASRRRLRERALS